MKKDFGKLALNLHKKNKGKIEIKTKVKLNSLDDFSCSYTPGVGAVCMEIAKNKKASWELTNRANTIAVISDGTAILGLGDIGPEAGMPVMEGKSAIFKRMANIDAYPICINTKDTEEIIKFCKNIEPSLAGINLEDISAPRCFEILERLEKELSIPVFHDDQDGTAIVTLAALINACRVSNKAINKVKVVINGAGAAGISITRLLISQGVKDIILIDSKGTIYRNRKNLNKFKKEIALKTNKNKITGGLTEAMENSDVFIGVSKGNLVSEVMVSSMNENPIIFAMANPIPEIMPDKAIRAGAFIVGTGRSDFNNQINNALVFPGIFKGLLKTRKKITNKMKISAATRLAFLIKKPTKAKILPNITDKKVVDAIAGAIK